MKNAKIEIINTPEKRLPKIEKGIDIPPRGYRKAELPIFMEKLEIGDSFVIKKQEIAGYRNAANKIGISLTERKVDEFHARVWRVS